MEQKKNYIGLTDAQVLESRKKYGANILTPPEKDPCAPLRYGRYPARRTRSYPPHDGFPTLRNDPAGQPNPMDATTALPRRR